MQKKQILITQVLSDAGAEMAQQFRDEGWYVFGLDTHDNYAYHCDRFLLFDFERFGSEAAYRIKMSAVFEELISRLDALVFQYELPRQMRSGAIDLDEWQSALTSQLTTPLLLAKLFAERLKKEKGLILSLIEQPAAGKPKPSMASRPIREALQAMTLSFAEDWAPHIRANVLSWQRLDESSSRPSSYELARLALFLASDETRLSGKIL